MGNSDYFKPSALHPELHRRLKPTVLKQRFIIKELAPATVQYLDREESRVGLLVACTEHGNHVFTLQFPKPEKTDQWEQSRAYHVISDELRKRGYYVRDAFYTKKGTTP